MSRTKSAEKPRQNLLRTKQTHSPPKPDKSAFFAAHDTAPAFPADIIIASPKRAKTKSLKIPAPVIAVPNDEAEPLLVRKSRSTQLKTTAKQKTAGKKAKTRSSAKLKAGNASAKPRARRKAAPEIAQSEFQAAPLDAVRLESPTAAPSLQNKILFDAPGEMKPLPRSAAVTAYRKNGPLDAFAYWLRSSGRSFTAFFKRRQPSDMPKSTLAEINRLRLENLALQRRIDMLLAERDKAAQ